jgi:N-acetylneuraminic acid mutarotase
MIVVFGVCQDFLTEKSALRACFVKKPLQKPFNHRNSTIQVGISMGKSMVLLLVLIFLTASCIITVRPALSSTAITENSWVSKAPMQVARSGLGVAVVNGKIYAIGGDARSGKWPYVGSIVDTNEEYDPEMDTWAFKTAMPTPRCDFAIAVYQNKIYCIGGITSVDDTGWHVTGVNEVYDPATDTWENKTSMPTARSSLQANVVKGKIYLIGGYVPDNSDFGFAISALNEVYDPATDSWTTKKPLPVATSDYPSVVVDDKIYITGGLSSAHESNLNQVYDPATDTWSQGALMPLGVRYGAAGATAGVNAPKRIYSISEFAEWSGTQVYDPLNGSWTFGARMPTSRLSFAVAVVNDRLYAIGGYIRTYPELYSFGDIITRYTTNEQYTPFRYGTVPPAVAVVSPENMNYTSGNVSLVFTVNKPASWMGYSLDGQETITVTGNTTITGLTNGSHNVTVYAKDEFENTGTSETILFTVAKEQEPFPATLVAAAAAIIAATGASLLLYFRKRKH